MLDSSRVVSQPLDVHLTSTTVVKGVVLPTWVAISMGVAGTLSALAVAAVLFLARQSFQESQAQTRSSLAEIKAQNLVLDKEIRLLQLHAQDIENVLIRQGLARREDMAPWTGDPTVSLFNRRER